jgi:large subunit ribosomal protein L21
VPQARLEPGEPPPPPPPTPLPAAPAAARPQADIGSTIKFGRVLAYKNNGQLTVGKPYLENINIEAEIVEELRGPKVIVYKMKPKKHYRRKQGHRQDLTKFMVTKVEGQ